MRKAAAIAKQAVTSYARDRIFHAVLVLALMMVLFSVFLATLTTLEQRKILLDFGQASISLAGIGFAILLGSTIVRKEMESRTIYTILSKPVRRTEYLAGKFLGAAVVVMLVHVICAAALGLVIFALGDTLPDGFVAAFYLTMLEALLVLAIALAFSLWCSSTILAATLSFAVFLIGRSNYSFRVMAEKTEGLPKALVKIAYGIFPSLQRFDIRDLVAYGKPYPEGMLSISSLYFLAYLALALGAAFLLFRKKDLP
jgi:Cu-processing system permease protein